MGSFKAGTALVCVLFGMLTVVSNVTDGDAASSSGKLVARPGMTIDEMKRLSSLPIKASSDAIFVDEIEFDFLIAGTGFGFSRCSSYRIATTNNDPVRVTHVSIRTSRNKRSRGRLAADDANLREQLAADGWLTGYEKTRTEQERRFHGGLPGRASGNIWLRDDVVLVISSRRLDDARPGEDAAKAGDWVQIVELSVLQSHSGIERYEFGKPQ